MFVQFGCVEDKALALLKWTGFLWRAHAQSGFKEGIRRMQRDQKLGIQP